MKPSSVDLAAQFRARFGAEPQAASFAPGRVNLIGEHTDYNDGLVLPMAIQFGVYGVGRRTADGRVRAFSGNFPEQPAEFAIGEMPHGKTWDHYLRAVLAELAAVGVQPAGLELLFSGDVPLEAGLSSSAAFSVSTALLVSTLLGRAWDDRPALAKLAQAAEHRTGVNCGILDQMASAACEAGSAMQLDCRDLAYEMIRLDRGRLAVIAGDTRVRRSLTDGRYNRRRAECEEAAQRCGVKTLREISLADLEKKRPALPDELYRRARHVLTENARVGEFAAALRANDLARVGAIADAGHASLHADFEVTCPELDMMVEAFRHGGAYGARMVGAGFGGSAIALVDPAKAETVIAAASKEYAARSGRQGGFHVVAAGDGAAVKAL
jgi:galactokinase